MRVGPLETYINTSGLEQRYIVSGSEYCSFDGLVQDIL